MDASLQCKVPHIASFFRRARFKAPQTLRDASWRLLPEMSTDRSALRKERLK